MTRSLKLKAVHRAALYVAVSLCLLAQGANAQQKDVVRRFAFISGSNDGGPGRIPLRYAHSDAKAMARVLTQLGGIDTRDSVILLEPDRFDFEAGLARMRGMLERARKQASGRIELVFYFSGHSDEQGLMLGDDLVTYRELRSYIADLPSDVRIAILDSCSSGAMTRGKGGTKRAPFLLDNSVEVEGYAYLTSASEDEAAQESDRISGSFFTYYLVSGLRGAADHNRDQKVTLNEAYQYAFNETLARTESTQAGPQHAGYDFQLKGSGDLVLTDLRGTSALLVIAPDIEGRVFIRNRKGQLVAEINTAGGNPVSMGLDPGVYEISMDAGRRRLRGTVSLNQGKSTYISRADLGRMTVENTIVRGDAPIPESGAPTAAPAPRKSLPIGTYDGEINRPFRLGLVPGVNFPFTFGRHEKETNNLSLNFFGYGHELHGAEVGALLNIRRFNMWGFQGAGIANAVIGRADGFQGAGVANLTLGEGSGFRGAGIFNFSGAAFKGFTAAGIANIVHGPTLGFEGAGVFNMNTASSHGFQGAGIANINGAGAVGFQGAGIFNFNLHAMNGFQGAGILNVAAQGQSSGFQGAGISNYAESFHGVQASGILNVASDMMQGTQIGLINYGRVVKGTQVGLINIASERLDGAAVGLVNYAGNGILAPMVWTSDTSFINWGLKMGGPFLYGILGGGVHTLGDINRYSVIGGFGGHIDFFRVWLELDTTYNGIFTADPWASQPNADAIVKFRPVLGVRIIDQFSFFVGPTLNMMITEAPAGDELISDFHTNRGAFSGMYYRWSVGYTVGVQWEPRAGDHNTH